MVEWITRATIGEDHRIVIDLPDDFTAGEVEVTIRFLQPLSRAEIDALDQFFANNPHYTLIDKPQGD